MDSWESRFKQFLDSRGVNRVPRRRRERGNQDSVGRATVDQTLPDIDDIDVDFNDDRVIEFFGLESMGENPDADEFYMDIDGDSMEYVAGSFHRDRRYSRDYVGEDEPEFIDQYRSSRVVHPSSASSGSETDDNDDEREEDDGNESGYSTSSGSEIGLDRPQGSHANDEFDFAVDDDSNDESSDTSAVNDQHRGGSVATLVQPHPNQLPISSQQAFSQWEFHDPTTIQEIQTNGGVYDPFRPDLSSVNPNDPYSMSRLAPAAKYRDLIQLRHIGKKKLYGLENTRKYKNNLSVVIGQYLVTCSASELVMYSFDRNHLPRKTPVLRFDVRPRETTNDDRLASTWPFFPHTINYVKTGVFLGHEVLAVCLDDGMIRIWNVETILQQVKRFGGENDTSDEEEEDEENEDDNRGRGGRYGLRIKADYQVKMSCSCWGLDFYKAKDNIIVASDNYQNVVLLYYDVGDRRWYHCASHQVLHNIPDVSFIEVAATPQQSQGVDVDITQVKVACSSISGEVLVFLFKFHVLQGPLIEQDWVGNRDEEVYYVLKGLGNLDSVEESNIEILGEYRLSRIIFELAEVTQRVVLPEEAWTCKPVSSRYFKPVASIRAMVGDPWIDEDREIEEISKESRLLDHEYDPVRTSHLGAGADWQFFETPVLQLSGPIFGREVFEGAQLTSVDDTYRRIYKTYGRTGSTSETTHSLNGKSYRPPPPVSTDQFLVVSTAKRLGLFRGDSLFCNGATKRVFDVTIPFNDESKYANRILIAHVIPELLCLVALTQQGLVTVMRLCQHRGLYGMRQEHLFPNALSLALGQTGYRTITGLAVRNVSPSEALPRYLLYLTYSDGLVLVHELRLGKLEEIEVDLMM